jgi:hypothetical protein
MTSMPNKLR